MIKNYYYLTKPGIIYGNAVTTIAGFFLASRGHFNFRLFAASLIGISLVIASACVFNNLMDRKIDERMERTKNRAMVTGAILHRNAIIFGVILALLGFLTLQFYTNILSLGVALVGFVVYVGIYSPLKPRSVYATLVGSIAGAVPPIVGYTAVSNRIDLGAIILFAILVTWQMPHFYSIAIRRLDEYRQARIPVLPAKKGILTTKIHMLIYIIAFIVAVTLLTVFKYASLAYLAVALLLGFSWLVFAIKGFTKNTEDKAWARKMFLISLLVITVLSLTISIDAIIYK